MKKQVRLFIILSLIALSGTMPVRANIGGVWQQHPAADIHSPVRNNCVKILDGERYTYFQILAQLRYNTGNYPEYQKTCSFLFRYDKAATESTAEIQPLAYQLPVSGTLVETAAYSFEGKYLAVVYTNGSIDIIHDDGRMFTCTALADYSGPGSRDANYITCDLDGKTFHVSTDFGFVSVDAATGKPIALHDLQQRVLFAGAVGDRMVLFTETLAYSFPKDKVPATLKDELPLSADPSYSLKGYVNADYSLRDPDQLFPLTDDSFLYMTTTTSGGTVGPCVQIATFDDEGKVRLIQPFIGNINYNEYRQNATYGLKFRNYGLVGAIRDGVICYNNGTPVIFRKGIPVDYSVADPGTDYKKNGFVICPGFNNSDLPAPAQTSKGLLYAGTCDGSSYWFFYPHEGFRRAVISGSSYVSDGTAYGVGSVEAYHITGMDYSSEYGMLVRNHGDEKFIWSSLTSQSDGLSALKEGSWVCHTLRKSNYAQSQRSSMPRGCSFDPLDHKYVWGGSLTKGLMRQNLKDPTDILQLCRNNLGTNGSNGYVHVHTAFPTYRTLSCFGKVKFDADATMWTPFWNWTESETGNTGVELWYWTAEDRKKSENASKDASCYVPMGILSVPTSTFSQNFELWPMRLPHNRNLVGGTSGNTAEAFLLDHNGTLSDPSDDRVAYFSDVYDENMVKLRLYEPTYMFEDPYDGHILVSYPTALLETTREEMFSATKRARVVKVAKDEQGMNNREIAPSYVTGIDVDPYGRKWIATYSDGVYCISEDRSELLAHFTKDNSDLPDDVCYGLIYNPDTRSIFVSTYEGLMEFIPYGSEGSGHNRPLPSVTPVNVSPEYKGYVTVCGLVDGASYAICAAAADGAHSGAPLINAVASEGMIQISAEELTSGEYAVTDKDGQVITTFIRL